MTTTCTTCHAPINPDEPCYVAGTGRTDGETGAPVVEVFCGECGAGGGV